MVVPFTKLLHSVNKPNESSVILELNLVDDKSNHSVEYRLDKHKAKPII